MFKICLNEYLLFCFILSSVVVVCGFNLSPEHAVVFKDPRDQEGSYFGYTVALHEHGWLIVGAPRGNSTHPNHLNITEPGTVYLCRTEGDAKCASQLLDSAGNDLNRTRKYLQHKHTAWIGGSLDIKSGKDGQIAVCGPRWVNLFYDDHDFQPGICYVTDVLNSESNAEKLLPFYKRTDLNIIIESNDTRTGKIGKHFYAYGQAGMSVHFTKNGEELIIGAPGVMEWTGTVLRYMKNDSGTPAIPNPHWTSELRSFSYLGYSVSSGNFLSGQNKTYYVSGAPRAGKEFQGEVYVFDIHTATQKDGEYRMKIIKTLGGTQTGEYFGAAICVLDVNGDGLDDVIVGAPHFGDAKEWDQGRIYVYLTTNVSGSLTIDRKQTLSSRHSEAQYGAAVSSLGDINKDGYNDFVVGAPYEDAGSGAIYVYHGGKEGPRGEVSQRIAGREFGPNIVGFGISFSRGLDIDGNKYNDIAVGAYKSGHAVVIKARPVIRYEAKIHPNVSSIEFNAENFTVTSCVKYTGKDVPQNVDTTVDLTLDKVYQRVTPRSITYDIRLTVNESSCREHQVLIKAVLQDFSKPIELRMQYKPKEDSGGDTFCKSCAVVDPKTPSFEKSTLPYVTGCSKDGCKPSLKIKAEFVGLHLPLVIGSQSTVSVIATVQNSQEPAFLAYAVISLPASCPLVRVPQICKTDGVAQRAPEKTLKCLMGNPLEKGKKSSVQLDFYVNNITSGTEQLVFNLSVSSAGTELVPKDNYHSLPLSLITQTDIGLSGYPDKDKIVLSKRKEIRENQTEFSHVYEVTNFGPSPLNMVDLEIKIPVSYAKFTPLIEIGDIEAHVDEKPMSCIYDTELKKLRKSFNVYTNSEPRNTTNETASIDKTDPEFDNATTDSHTSKYEDSTGSGNMSTSEGKSHESRSASIASESKIPNLTQTAEGTLFINCKDSASTCVTLRCSLNRTITKTSRAVVYFSMSAATEDLESVLGESNAIVITTTGKAKIASPKNVLQTETDSADEADVTTVLHGKIKLATVSPVTLGVAAAIAVFLLFVIIGALWKIGFFKRKRPEEQYKGLIQRQMDE